MMTVLREDLLQTRARAARVIRSWCLVLWDAHREIVREAVIAFLKDFLVFRKRGKGSRHLV